MRKTALLAVILPLLLLGCATAPSGPPTVLTVCPRIPALQPLDPETAAALERDYSETIQQFLSGLLPTPTDFGLRSGPAAPTTNGLRLR
jgi:hypothetical protein